MTALFKIEKSWGEKKNLMSINGRMNKENLVHLHNGILQSCWAGEMESVVKSTDCSSKGPEFKSQQPHGDSEPSIMRSNALFWGV